MAVVVAVVTAAALEQGQLRRHQTCLDSATIAAKVDSWFDFGEGRQRSQLHSIQCWCLMSRTSAQQSYHATQIGHQCYSLLVATTAAATRTRQAVAIIQRNQS